MRVGGVGERVRSVRVWKGDAAPPRDALGIAPRCAQSGPGAPGRRRARPPRGEESRDIRSARVSLALVEARSLRSAARGLGPRQPPPLSWELTPRRREAVVAPPRDSSVQWCRAVAPGGGTFFPLPQPPGRPSLPLGPSSGPGKPRSAPGTGPSPEQPLSLGVVQLSTKTGSLFPTLKVRQRSLFRVWIDAKSCYALLQAAAPLLEVPKLF